MPESTDEREGKAAGVGEDGRENGQQIPAQPVESGHGALANGKSCASGHGQEGYKFLSDGGNGNADDDLYGAMQDGGGASTLHAGETLSGRYNSLLISGMSLLLSLLLSGISVAI